MKAGWPCNNHEFPDEESERKEMDPALLLTGFVKSKKNKKLGTLFDKGSTDHYILKEVAERQNFRGTPVELVVDGIGGTKTNVDTMLYQVTLVDNSGGRHVVMCYGMDKICDLEETVDQEKYESVVAKFKISPDSVKRPKKIEMLLGVREPWLHPKEVKQIDNMALHQGIFGKVLGGSDKDLKEKARVFRPQQVHLSTACKAALEVINEVTCTNMSSTERKFIDYFKEENIGIDLSLIHI